MTRRSKALYSTKAQRNAARRWKRVTGQKMERWRAIEFARMAAHGAEVVIFDMRNVHKPTRKPMWQMRCRTHIEKKFDGKCIIGYKKAMRVPTVASYGDMEYQSQFVIVKLEIPASARRQQRNGARNINAKCRAAMARVLEITSLDGKEHYTVAYGRHGIESDATRVVYQHGCAVKPKGHPYDPRWDECSAGIHFFLRRDKAVSYSL